MTPYMINKFPSEVVKIFFHRGKSFLKSRKNAGRIEIKNCALRKYVQYYIVGIFFFFNLKSSNVSKGLLRKIHKLLIIV